MSTKIYNGLKLNGCNINDLFNILSDIKPKLKDAAKIEAYKFLSNLFIRNYDLKLSYETIMKSIFWNNRYKKVKDYFELVNGRNNNNLLSLLANIINEMNYEMKNSLERNPSFDYNLNLTIYTDDKNILLYPCCEHKPMLKIIEESFIEYGYWNNSDRLENLSEDEWDDRRISWDKALDKDIILQFELYTTHSRILDEYDRDILADAILPLIKPKTERASHYAKKQLNLEIFKNITKDIDNKIITDNIFTYDEKAKVLMKSKENIIKYDEYYNIWLSKLEDITVDIIKNYIVPLIDNENNFDLE